MSDFDECFVIAASENDDYDDRVLDEESDIYDFKDFKKLVSRGCFSDYDGMAYACRRSSEPCGSWVEGPPIELSIDSLPASYTHVVWYNR